MVVRQQGDAVNGTYSRQNGRITGRAGGRRLTGTWSEAPSYKEPKDAGAFELTLAADGRSFTGNYRYAGSAKWDGPWVGNLSAAGASVTSREDPPDAEPAPARTPAKPGKVGIALGAGGAEQARGLAVGDRLWQPAGGALIGQPLPGPALALQPALDTRELAGRQFAGGAAVALAGIRELAGPLTTEEEAKLDAKWAPYLTMPSSEAGEYFDKLAPVLMETAALRTAVATAAAEFDAAWNEAAIAASYGSENGVREALAIADTQRATLVASQARLAGLAAKAKALGNPPNPIAARNKARTAHTRAVATVKAALPAKPAAGPRGAWVLQRVSRTDRQVAPIICNNINAAAKYTDTSYSFRANWALPPDHPAPVRVSTRFEATWTAPPPKLPADETFTITIKFDREFGESPRGYAWGQISGERIRDNECNVLVFSDRLLHPDPRERWVSPADDKDFGMEKGQLLGFAPKGMKHALSGTENVRILTPRGTPGQLLRLTIRGSDGHSIVSPVGYAGANMYRVYTYAWTTNAGAIANAGKDVAEDSSEQKAQQDAVQFHEGNLRIIERNLNASRSELAKETDPTRRAALEWRILQGQSDLVAERDLITSIETGQIVHTRSPFDTYAHDRFVQGIRENQQQMEAFQRATASLQRLAGMLPDSEQEQARQFIARQVSGETVAKLDMAGVRKVADALSQKVQGYAARDAAKQEEKEAWATLGLDASERIKYAADGSMMACAILGGQGVMMAYQGATGYIEGGLTEGILRTAAWYGTPAYVATEAFRGYSRTDEKGNARGLVGAAKDAGTAFVMAKLFEYGTGKVRRAMGAPAMPKGPTVREQQELAAFSRARQQGEARARQFTRAQADLEAAARSGASPQTIQKLQRNIRDVVTTIHADPYAKNYLKYKGDFHSQRAYNAHMTSVHADVEAAFHRQMDRQGWNRQPLKEFRNASSAGSVGMDHDIGLDEAAARALLKGRKRATVAEWQSDAQKAWDQAYQQTTGRSAGRSWETVTTSGHAESYRDLNWLSSQKDGVQKAWGQQAGDVTRYKAWHLQNDPGLGQMLKLQEMSRGAAKDMGSKLRPILNAVKPKSAASVEPLQQARRHWQRIETVMEAFGNNTLDPITASRRIREITGGKDIPQVVDEMGTMLESLTKAAGK
jgi:hypothetical protein